MRLIDADGLDVIGYTGTDGRPNTFDDGVIWTLEKMDAMPTIDAVPVVRCRDCRYVEPTRNPARKDELPMFCTLHRENFKDGNEFCSLGQRREDGDGDV